MKHSNNIQNINKEKGITLIALVITIIVLLILAGVSIATLTGNNGILTQTEKAKNESEIGKEKEVINLATSTLRSQKTADGKVFFITKDELKKEIESLIRAHVIVEESQEGENILVVEFESGRKYNVVAKDVEEKDLLETVKVGDYINYPIVYTNETSYNPNWDTDISDIGTGWRVMSTNNNTIQLISEGAPILIGDHGEYQREIDNYVTNFDSYTSNKFINEKFAVKGSGLTIELINDYLKSINKNTINTNIGEDSVKLEDSKDIFYSTKEYTNFSILNTGINMYGNVRLLTLSGGDINATHSVDNQVYLRIVITLKQDLKCIGGDGSKSLPYEIKE